MNAYEMTYRDDYGRRVVRHLLARDAAAAWNQAFDIAERLANVQGFAVAPAQGAA